MRRLTYYERQQIAFWHQGGLKIRDIATIISRDHSVVSREIARNKGQLFPYSAMLAQKATERRAKLTNKRKLDKDDLLRQYVENRLKDGWSPEQIAGRLKYHPPPKLKGRFISHEHIYRYIYAGAMTESGQRWYHSLRRGQPRRQKWYSRKSHRLLIPDRVSIRERPAVVDNKQRLGDWEVDLLCFGRQKQAVSVHYERKSRFAHLHKVSRHTAEETTDAIAVSVESLPDTLWRTITFDNGGENVGHVRLKDEYGLKTYFCDPYKSWQKGGVENMNGLLRQYLPRKTNLAEVGHETISLVQGRLNNRPRRGLQFRTPNEIINQHINQNGALNS